MPRRNRIGANLPACLHALAVEDALGAMASDAVSGLSASEAARRLAAWGPNDLPRPTPPGRISIFLRQFRSPLIYLLLAAAAVSVALRQFGDSAVILVVVLVNALVGTLQEARAQRSLEKL